MKVAPKRDRSSTPWVPANVYVCTLNPAHIIAADRPICAPCPVCVHGEPCGGDLHHTGILDRGRRC